MLALIGLITIKSHPDFEWYHLPYLNYLKDYKIIFGIGNINDFLGYTQTWNDVAAIFRIPIIDYKAINLVPAIFAIFFLINLLEISANSKNISLKIFIYLILIFSISKYYKIYEYGGHVPAILIGFLVNIYFFKLITDHNKNHKEIIFKILFFSSFVFLLRINYIFIAPVIVFIIWKYNKVVFDFLTNKKIITLILFLLIIFFTKNIIVSGCFIYPVNWTCFSPNQINWAIGHEFAKERYDLIKALARGWSAHILLDGNIKDRINYLTPLLEKKILTPSAFLSEYKYLWIKYWIHIGDSKKILNNFLIIIFCLLILLPYSNIKKIFIIEKKIFKNYLVIFFIFLIQLVLWFLLTPQTIYGGDVATIIFSGFIASFLLQNLDFNHNYSKRVIILLFILSIFYYEAKNINRFYYEFIKNNINFFQSPWIIISENKFNETYYQHTIDEFIINIKKKIDDRNKGLPDVCGNIAMMCLPEDRIKCVRKIKEISGYIFVYGNESLCLQHIKKRYFY